MDVNNFLQSEATQFVGTAAANTIGLVNGTSHEDIKDLLEIPDEYQAISIVSSRTGTVAQAIAIDDAVKAVNAKLLRFEMAIDAGKQCGQGCLFVLGAENISDARRLVEIALEQIDYWAACMYGISRHSTRRRDFTSDIWYTTWQGIWRYRCCPSRNRHCCR